MKKLCNFRLALFAALFLVCGLLVAYFCYFDTVLWAIAVAAVFVVSAIIFVVFPFGNGKRTHRLIFVGCFLFLCVFGTVSFTVTVERYDAEGVGGHYYDVCAKVKSITPTDDGVRAVLTDVSVDGTVKEDLSYDVVLTVYEDCEIDVGDVVEFNAQLTQRSSLYGGRFCADYVSAGIKYSATVDADDLSIVGNRRTIFDAVNLFMRRTLAEGMGEEEFSVAYAMLTGGSEYMEEYTLSNFRSAGVAHIFAVSGLHIGFLAGAIGFILKKAKANGKVGFFITVPLLIFYSGVCGFSSSSLRAAVMCATALAAKMFGEKYDGLSAAGLSALILLLIFPLQLFCAGFLLSYFVAISVILFSNAFTTRIKNRRLSKAVVTVLSAQLAGIPLSLYFFGEFSLIAVACNLVFIPLVGFIYVLTLIAVIVGGLFNIPTVALFVSNKIFTVVIKAVNLTDLSVFMTGDFTFGGYAVFYYGAMILAAGLVNVATPVRIVSILLSIAICATGTALKTSRTFNATKLCVYSTGSFSATVISEGNDSALIVSAASGTYRTYGLGSAINRAGAERLDALIILNADDIDVATIVTRVYAEVDFDEVYYFGEKDELSETALKASFNGLSVTHCDASEVNIAGRIYRVGADGKSVASDFGNGVFAVYAEFGDDFIAESVCDADVSIVFDYADYVEALTGGGKTVTYVPSSGYTDAYSSGNLFFTAD